MTDTKIVNLHNLRRGMDIIKIDRSSEFGNPFRLIKDGGEYTRTESVEKYREYFHDKIENDEEFKERVESLKGKTLGCWCKPKKCHGDIIVEYLDDKQ